MKALLDHIWALVTAHEWDAVKALGGWIVAIIVWLRSRRKQREEKQAKEEAQRRERAAENRAIIAAEREAAAAKRAEASEKRQIVAEEELRNIRRRGNAPYIVPSQARFNSMYVSGNAPGTMQHRHMHHPDMLTVDHPEVATTLPAGSRVFLLIDNTGKPARGIDVLLDGRSIRIEAEPQMSDSRNRQMLIYPYDPSKHGIEQQIQLSFEAYDGSQDIHIYVTRHGFRELRRVDPA